jgi:hypothetical protein
VYQNVCLADGQGDCTGLKYTAVDLTMLLQS